MRLRWSRFSFFFHSPMTPMMSGGSPAWFAAGAALHVLFSLLFAIGIIFLLVWTIKTLPMLKLRNWGIGLLVIGLLGCILTVFLAFAGFHGGMREGGGKMMPGMCSMMKEKDMSA